jgi:hypothetical protein
MLTIASWSASPSGAGYQDFDDGLGGRGCLFGFECLFWLVGRRMVGGGSDAQEDLATDGAQGIPERGRGGAGH